MSIKSRDETRVPRWYFGGLAATGAAICSHPLDLIKVNLQTSQEKLSIFPFIHKLIREQGILTLYNGLSASVLRQMTYSTARFGIYEVAKPYFSTNSFLGKIMLAGLSGGLGGFVGTPADLINVRMQNDVSLPSESRRNYKHGVDGILRVYQEEGIKRLYSGASAASIRGGLMTIGQIAFYDQIKGILLESGYFEDNVTTHFTSSLAAGSIATTLTQPLDVVKTRSMNARPGEFKGLFDIIKQTAMLGPQAFFKGFIPSFVRVGPSTIILFIILEQLRLNFGYLPVPESKNPNKK